MVQRLSLLGVVSPEELEICMRSMEAISGMQPREFEVTREVWEPKYRYKPTTSGMPAQIEQYRLFILKSANSVILEAHEVPEAGRNIRVISNTVLSTQLQSSNDEINEFMTELGYEFKSAHTMKGKEFILHEHIIVHIFELHDKDGQILDSSRQRIVRAMAEVESVADLNAVEQATQMLLNTQQELRGIVSLKAPNRGAFNTRMPRVAT